MKKLMVVLVLSALGLSPSVFATDASAAKPIASAAQQGTIQGAVQGTVNINTADAQTLTQLKGVGLKKAEDIIAWRKANGNFKTIEQLAEVKGISTKTLEANRAIIRLQ